MRKGSEHIEFPHFSSQGPPGSCRWEWELTLKILKKAICLLPTWPRPYSHAQTYDPILGKQLPVKISPVSLILYQTRDQE
jgi:hypothetical protein